MKITALILLSFVASTAILSGLALLFYPDGRLFQMPLSLLNQTVFVNFFIPGLILCLVVGGANLAGALALVFDYTWANRTTFFGGLCLSGWIVGQYLLIRTFNWLQVLYLMIGLALLLISFQVKKLHGSTEEVEIKSAWF